MLEQIAALKIAGLVGYAFLVLALARSRVPPTLKIHFGLYLLGLGFWQLTAAAVTLTPSAPAAVRWYNLQAAGLALQSIIFFPFTRVFLRRRGQRVLAAAAYAACVAAVSLCLPGFAVREVVIGRAGYYIPAFDPVVAAVTAAAYLFWALGVVNLAAGLRREPLALQRARITLVLVGAAVVMVGLATDFTPLQSYPVDSACVLANALLVSYAVTRYRLIDPGTVVKRGLAVLLSAALAVGGYVLLSMLAGVFLRPPEARRFDGPGLVGFVLMLAVLLAAGRRYSRDFLDRIMGKRSAGYDRVLERFSLRAKSLLDVDALQDLILRTAADSLGVDAGFLLFLDAPRRRYAVVRAIGRTEAALPEFTLEASDRLVAELRALKTPLWEQEALLDPRLGPVLPSSGRLFTVTGASVAVPIIHEEEVLGIVGLGSRQSGSLFSDEDMRFLSTLANVAASSLAVALTYRTLQQQLSHQTLLFVLSDSLVKHVGTEDTARCAVAVLKTFLDVDECVLVTLDDAGGPRAHSARPLTAAEEEDLIRAAERLASTDGREAAGGPFFRAAQASQNAAPGFAQSLVFLPLTRQEQWIGALALARSEAGMRAGEADALFRAISAILSQGLIADRSIGDLRVLTEYNEKLLAGIGASGEMLFVTDCAGIILRTNGAARDALGFTEDELAGRALGELCARGAGSLFPPQVVQNREVKFVSKSGTLLPALVSSAAIGATGGSAVREVVVLARDISALREMEIGLLESEGRYRALFESVLDAVVTFDLDGQLFEINPAGRRLLGIEHEGAEELWNLRRDFFADPQTFRVLRQDLAADGGVRDREIALRARDGRTRICLFSGALDRDRSGPVPMVHGIIRDVTEQRDLQSQLLQAQKMESVGTLAGGIAHDFNNILTATLGYAKLIREDVTDPDAVLSHLEIVESSTHRAVDLTRRLLSFARAGITDRTSVPVNAIVEETVRLIRRTFDPSIEIAVDRDPDLPPVLGDHGQIHQMLMNLCVNARDAMPDGGTLCLRTRREGGTVLLEVSDTGAGILPSDLPRIFDPFFTTKEAGKGTGLGLSIVYGIVQRHGGRIQVSSTPGRGTTFLVLLPAAAAVEAPPAAVEAPPAALSGRETIMIVDDEPDLRTLFRITLGARGYTIVEAADGMEAVETFRRRRGAIDLVLIDLVMPRLGGRETYLRLRRMDPGVKALFATGYGIDDKVRDLLSLGALGIIKKPYEIPAVEKEIRRVLDGSRR